jgi:DedD protein
MGLFSFFRKNKQDRTAEDSGRFYSKDDDAALGERARAKRAGSAGGAGGGATRRPGNDPLLPEKKRARRRLVGAIALALAAAVGLPMLLDSGPKQLASDIAIQIPSKDKAAPLPVPGESAQPAASAPQAAAGDKTVAAEDSVDKGEEIVEPPPAAVKAPKPEPKPESKPDSKPERKAETPKPEPKPEHKEHKPEHKESRPEHKESKPETRLADKADKAEKADKPKPEEKVKPKLDEKVKPVKDDAARAMAILEGKPGEKDKPQDAGASQKFVLQVAAMSSQEKAAEVQARLREAGISSHTQKFGELIRIRVGPLSKDEAERVRAKLGKLGYAPSMTPV